MKTNQRLFFYCNFVLPRKEWLLVIIVMLFSSYTLSAQEDKTIKGVVKSAKDEMPIPGVNVLVKGTNTVTVTGLDGEYSIKASPKDILVFSYLGYSNQEMIIGNKTQLNIALSDNLNKLDEVVVIGYGTQKKSDLTGSVSVVNMDNAKKTVTYDAAKMLQGQVAGVTMQTSGEPGGFVNIKIRGINSFSNNNPLFVIDGMIVDSPYDFATGEIESMQVLKDASSAAIYGVRGANGVIIITTKKGKDGKQPFSVNLQQNTSLSTVVKTVNVLTGDEFRAILNENGSDKQKELLGTENTDWQSEIYRVAKISETNVSVTGGITKLPYRLSAGFKHEEGVLLRDQMNRTAIGLNLTPKLLKDHLAIEMNSKYSRTSSVFADKGAIGSAVTFDPTQPVNTDSDRFGGYYEYVGNNGIPNPLAPKNPLGLLNSRDDFGNADRFIGNLKLDYKIHFLPDLHFVVNGGYDYSNGYGTVNINDSAASNYAQGGRIEEYNQTKQNRLLETYFNYSKKVEKINSEFDATAGYSYQRWKTETDVFPVFNQAGDTLVQPGIPGWNENALISYYGRLIYTLAGKYMLTGTIRRDGSSRFAPENRWGLFPSAAAAWRISDEDFLKDSRAISYLKLRAGYGVTGQQDIGNDYPYLANYQTSTTTAYYQLGNQFYSLLRPDGFDYNIKWEETASTNIGVDYGFWRDRIFGSVDFYIKNTKDLLAIVDVPAGANFKNEILTNVGEMTNRGVEFEISYVAISKKEMNLTFGANATMNRNEITKLSATSDSNQVGILTGGISGSGIGNNVQVHTVGYPTNSFYVYQQLYNAEGLPVQEDNNGDGVFNNLDRFADLNGDSIINGDDRYRLQKTAPDLFLGFYTNFTYKNWSAGFSLRSEIGRYVYNNVNSSRGWFGSIPSQNFLTNLDDSYNTYGLMTSSTEQVLSDLYVERADFVRMDYLNVGYSFNNLLNKKLKLTVSAIVNNVFMMTNYSGLDPEISGGIDNNFYPRPRVFSLNLNFQF
jgi:TonB-dependent starch-binding outer membrane protein SusC